MDLDDVALRPLLDGVDDRQDGSSLSGQLVVDPKRDRWRHGPGHEPVALQRAQGLGEAQERLAAGGLLGRIVLEPGD
jgi:hypothetical protein